MGAHSRVVVWGCDRDLGCQSLFVHALASLHFWVMSSSLALSPSLTPLITATLVLDVFRDSQKLI